ncbi:Arm DNA-binding domain-containing protein [Clostridium cadaveris]|uniref:Arm DNA-binding domain-containing protein n=1 Tax=Clostridium cadaveris TaxID=1529 RepID=UPI00310145F5
MSQVRVKNYIGKTIHKKKRGFATKKRLWSGKETFSTKPMQIWVCCFRILLIYILRI